MKKASFVVSRSGVTLIEILVAFAILAMISGAISSGTGYLTERLVRAEKATIARNLAWKRVVEVKSAPLRIGHNVSDFGKGFSGFEFAENINRANIGGKSDKGLYEYEIVVSWKQAYKRDSLELHTLLAEYNK